MSKLRTQPTSIRWVQQALNKVMGLRLAVDGIMGNATRDAVRMFQKRYGLGVDGIIGSKTHAALQAASVTRHEKKVLNNFHFDNAQLKPEHHTAIEEIARKIVNSHRSSNPIRLVQIEGHTDPVGSQAYNLELGKRRAESAARHLRATIERMQPGLGQRITFRIKSWGESVPVPGGAVQSRRVEILLPYASPPSTCRIVPVSTVQRATIISAAPQGRKVITTPSTRPCCMLAPAPDFATPGNLGKHGTSNEVNALIYTCKAGFIDLGHIRDMCDMTRYIHEQLTQGITPQRVTAEYNIKGFSVPMGEAEILQCPANNVQVARAIALDVGMGHEIVTYKQMTPGGHNSSFSPEDLCSNFLGTLLAERALAAKRPFETFETVVTRELDKLVLELDGQPPQESRKAFDRINVGVGRWVKWNNNLGKISLVSDDYLQRRNFSQIPFKAGHPCDSATPAFITTPLPDLSGVYRYTHKERKSNIPAARYRSEIDDIKADARRRYGSDFDQP
jgi:outer membrane protein OmpA-like peptidoglycan-associated protein